MSDFLHELSQAEARIADLERQLEAKDAQIELLLEMADQRSALIEELIRRLPEEEQTHDQNPV